MGAIFETQCSSFQRRVFPGNWLHWYWQPTSNQITTYTLNTKQKQNKTALAKRTIYILRPGNRTGPILTALGPKPRGLVSFMTTGPEIECAYSDNHGDCVITDPPSHPVSSFDGTINCLERLVACAEFYFLNKKSLFSHPLGDSRLTYPLRWSSKSTTSWSLSSTSRCAFKLHRTWSTTASWSQTPDAPNFAPLTPTFLLFWEQTLDLATGVSGLEVRDIGTVYPPHCDSLTWNSGILNDF